MTSQEWKNKGNFLTIKNQQVFVIDEGNSDKTLVILHTMSISVYYLSIRIGLLSSIYAYCLLNLGIGSVPL